MIEYKDRNYSHQQFYKLLNKLLTDGFKIYFQSYKNEDKNIEIECDMDFPFGKHLSSVTACADSIWKSLEVCMNKRREFLDDMHGVYEERGKCLEEIYD